MDILDQVHISLSVFSAFAFVAAFFIARDAMRKGLTYECLAATLWGLGFIAAGRIWHAFYEALQLTIQYGKLPETVEYAVYLVGFTAFAMLMWRGYNIRGGRVKSYKHK